MTTGGTPAGRSREVLVNGLFLAQAITGQQRFAQEVLRRLSADPSVRTLRAPDPVGTRPVLAHLWAQLVVPVAAARSPLLSLTARSPVVARRHVLVVHDLFPVTHPEWYTRTYAATHAAQLTAQLRMASTLAAVSEPLAAELRRRYPRTRVVVAPNAPAACFTPAPDDGGAAMDPADGGQEDFLLAVGTLDPRKNFARLLRAYLTLPEDLRKAHPLWIAGGQGLAFSSIGVDLDGMDDTVRPLGYLGDQALATLYRRAAAVVVPSLDEGFGLPLVEAMATGAPVVASDIPVFRWVAGEGVAYFDPLSERSIADALAGVLESPPSSRQRQENREVVVNRFRWEATAASLLAELRSLL